MRGDERICSPRTSPPDKTPCNKYKDAEQRIRRAVAKGGRPVFEFDFVSAGGDRDALQHIIYAVDRRSLPVDKRIPAPGIGFAQDKVPLIRVLRLQLYSLRVGVIDRYCRPIPTADYRKFCAMMVELRLVYQNRFSWIEWCSIRQDA